MSDYKKTLHLPQTSFPMKANLTQREPQTLAFWEKEAIAKTMVETNADRGAFILHDGPPYANGNIHLGTALNKILKDIIVKSRNMQGFAARYVPGWDCHGLPIEHKVAQELGEKFAQLPPVAVRKRCRDYATKWLNTQRKEFKRLGVLGDWDHPYQTMDPAYEAATARELGRFMEKNSVFRSKKPVHWCCSCQTALAEAEVEYKDHTSPSIYVAFPLPDARLAAIFPQADTARAHVVIWTTTPWTLPDNMAVALHPDHEYALVEADGRQFVLAEYFVPGLADKFGWKEWKILAKTPGASLEGLIARHPFFDRPSPIVLADYVTLDAGTGCVHTAPGHGREDYETGLKYGLEILSPLDDAGRFMDSVDQMAGLTVFQANPKVIEILTANGRLLGSEKIAHSYPHCWRCKEPVIFRATTQWFVSMAANALREKALKAIREDVQWIPAWGEDRIFNMIENRPDWCISRQRMWGVPIVALRCTACDEAWFEADWVYKMVERFAKHPRGCDDWFEAPLEEIIPAHKATCSCGGQWKKETDILDVWFDSGSSFAAVLKERPELSLPADLYLEGSDQHRGWFHSSLLIAVGNEGAPPYKAVLTHGYVVDGEGRKMSKSIGNVVAPQEIIDKFGAEILRLWVASVDYTEDVRISDAILSGVVDGYRRIRNTCRFLLGNLFDFTPEDALAYDDLLPYDRFALDQALRLHAEIQAAYDRYEFHKVYHALYNYCVTDLSALYLDIAKDRLYVEGKASRERRSCQTVLWRVLMLMLQNMAPILSFTAEEVFGHLPAALKPDLPSVLCLGVEREAPGMDEALRERWGQVLAMRAAIVAAMEPLRKSGEVGHSLSGQAVIYIDEDLQTSLRETSADLRELCILSRVEVLALEQAPAEALATELGGMKLTVGPAAGGKCERCWIVTPEVSASNELCPRCARVVADNPPQGA
ncbi:isoleucine--tRNA ligase [Megalodesulfovibrio paquesii]